MKKTLLALCLLSFSSAFGQQPGNFTHERLLTDLTNFTLPTWEQRQAAFRDIFDNADPEDSGGDGGVHPSEEDTTSYLLRTLAPGDKELFKIRLIALLRRESAFENSLPVGGGGVDEGERFSTYLEDVAISVMTLRDPRSIPALLDIVQHRGPIDEIARFGEVALGPSLDRLAHTPTTVGTEDEELRMDLTILLSEFMRPGNRAKLQPQSVVKVKNTFQTLASDPSPFVRENSVRGLGYFANDPDIKAVLTQLAQHDTAANVQRAAASALKVAQ